MALCLILVVSVPLVTLVVVAVVVAVAALLVVALVLIAVVVLAVVVVLFLVPVAAVIAVALRPARAGVAVVQLLLQRADLSLEQLLQRVGGSERGVPLLLREEGETHRGEVLITARYTSCLIQPPLKPFLLPANLVVGMRVYAVAASSQVIRALSWCVP